jgi:hypothetical protein
MSLKDRLSISVAFWERGQAVSGCVIVVTRKILLLLSLLKS